jgi:hypothetical protein
MQRVLTIIRKRAKHENCKNIQFSTQFNTIRILRYVEVTWVELGGGPRSVII